MVAWLGELISAHNGCETFRRWIEKSVLDLPQDTQFVEEQNGFISLNLV